MTRMITVIAMVLSVAGAAQAAPAKSFNATSFFNDLARNGN
jgi:hypothetical protein